MWLYFMCVRKLFIADFISPFYTSRRHAKYVLGCCAHRKSIVRTSVTGLRKWSNNCTDMCSTWIFSLLWQWPRLDIASTSTNFVNVHLKRTHKAARAGNVLETTHNQKKKNFLYIYKKCSIFRKFRWRAQKSKKTLFYKLGGQEMPGR